MPWLSIPLEDKRKEALTELYQVPRACSARAACILCACMRRLYRMPPRRPHTVLVDPPHAHSALPAARSV